MSMTARTRDFYVRHVAQQAVGEYGMPELDAVRAFVESETYQMLIDESLCMHEFSPVAMFDIWVAERELGNPRLSAYIAGE